ncbi:enolase-phosphatase E1 isoform X2 [Gouania willdenowi]|nr:enolase-phosphatase E1-like isoform X2 [Gouania willdenowi]
MAQLTEDIQPSFETTLKSKAVSENCNVKFTCVVSGCPPPELKWYKDDMEMDRYCGLPKYEIRKNGKTHTLHVYNCTLDDAAIYQVSASNSKGIVSCSGVLEVGTMSEFQIHQRFFAKLKQKAEKKKKDMDQQNKKENILQENPQRVPEPPQRKRHVQPTEKALVKEPMEQLETSSGVNGVHSADRDSASVITLDNDSSSQEIQATKRSKLSNGVDAAVNSTSSTSSSRTNMMGIGGENCYDGGMSLAQFLADTLQSQDADEKMSSSVEEKANEADKAAASEHKEIENNKDVEEKVKKQKEQENVLQEAYEKAQRREEELVIEREKEIERHLVAFHTASHGRHGSDAKHHSKNQKDHEHHNIQTSISSMFHSVKDFLFGKNKKDSHSSRRSLTEREERDFDHQHHSPQSPRPETRPSLQLQQKLHSEEEQCEPMETDGPKEQKSEPCQLILEDLASTCNTADETVEEFTGQNVSDDVVEATQKSTSGLQRNTEDSASVEVTPVKPEPQDISPQTSQHVAIEEPALKEEIFIMPPTQTPPDEECVSISTMASMEDFWTPRNSIILESNSLDEAIPDILQETKMCINSLDEKSEPITEEVFFFNNLQEEEKPLVDTNRPYITESTFVISDQTKLTESEAHEQVLVPQADVTSYLAEGDHVVEDETKDNSQAQETNLPSAAETSDIVDPIIQPACTLSTDQEITGNHNLDEKQSSNFGFTSGEERCEWNKLDNLALENIHDHLDSHFSHVPKIKEQVSLESVSVEVKSESLLIEAEKSVPVETEKLPECVPGTQNKNNIEKQSCDITHLDTSSGEQAVTFESEPQVVICVVPDIEQNDYHIISKNKTTQPDLEELTVRPNDSTPKQSEPTGVKKHDTAHLVEFTKPDESMANSPDSLDTQKPLQNEEHLSPTEKLRTTTQQQQPQQMDFAPIPVINVSCTDDKEGAALGNAHISHVQPRVPLFVVPPISITCHESDPDVRLPIHSKSLEKETSVDTQRGTKQREDKNITANEGKSPSMKEDEEEKSDKNTPAVQQEVVTQKAGENVPSLSKTTEDDLVSEVMKEKSLKDGRTENFTCMEDLQKNRVSVERLASKPPTYPALSPGSLRKFMSKTNTDADSTDKADEDLSGGSTPTSSLSCESSPRMKRRDSLTLIRSATPEELASGARRKIFIPRAKEDLETSVDAQGKRESPYMSPSQARRAALLQASTGQLTPPMEKRSPLLMRRKATLEVPKVTDEPSPEEQTGTKKDEKPEEKKLDPLKAPQVIRKIRGEPFPDASGHLKLWCQFFNVLSDSTIKWYRDEEEILELKRSRGDETQVALAIVLASNQDCGVYGCTIQNEYGTDTTDFLLSADILSNILLLRDDLEVGEEIEMTPMLFTKGLADCGSWGNKYFGRIITEASHIGEGCAHKACRVKVIYGLDPVFESGSTCVIKVQNPIAYGTKDESNLVERNLDITKQECKVQNMIREYCKIFVAESRVNENFGFSLEVIPRYLMYRPANSVPYASVEADLSGDFCKYATMDAQGKLITKNGSEVEQKCSTFQHWIHQWTHGNLLVTHLEGVETKMTNIRVVTKSSGYQGLTQQGSPEVYEQFLTHHQCNYYCGLLGLRPLKSTENLQQSSKIKGSRSPLLNRKVGSNSPQLQKKALSPQTSRKTSSSPKVSRKVQEAEDSKSVTKPAETPDVLEMR